MSRPRHSPHSIAWRFTVLVILFALAGCVPQHVESSPRLEHGVRVEIDNREFADMQVYLIRDGARVYLGTVNGHSVRTFVVQGPLLAADGRLSLLAGTRTRGDLLVSPIVMAMPGQQVSWRLEFASFGRSVMIR